MALSGLVRCDVCRDALVQPGVGTCSACRKPWEKKAGRKLHGLVMPVRPRPADIATVPLRWGPLEVAARRRAVPSRDVTGADRGTVPRGARRPTVDGGAGGRYGG